MSILKFTFPLALSAALIAGPFALAQSVTGTTTTSTTTTRGLVSEMGPDALTIRTESSAVPIRYASSVTTTFVDEAGAPVSRELVASGLPVTVTYLRDGERLIAQQVVVHRQTTPAPTVIEKSTTITPPPVVVEKKVYVDRPVIVEKKVPVEVEKKVYVDRPVIVEKPAPPPALLEKKTTTTTTTTAPSKKED